MRNEAKAREEDREIYTAGGRQREMSVSLTGAAVIFTLYQCCADPIGAVLICAAESRQTDRQTAAI